VHVSLLDVAKFSEFGWKNRTARQFFRTVRSAAA
jgi:hypothetical protein